MGTETDPKGEHQAEGRGRVEEAKVFPFYPPLIRLRVVTMHNGQGYPLNLQVQEARETCPDPDGIPGHEYPKRADKGNCWLAKDVRHYRFDKPEQMKELLGMVEGATTSTEQDVIKDAGGRDGIGWMARGKDALQTRIDAVEGEKAAFKSQMRTRPQMRADGSMRSTLTKKQRKRLENVLTGAYVTLPISEEMIRKMADGTFGLPSTKGEGKGEPEAGTKESAMESLVKAARAAGMNATVEDGQTVVTGRDGSQAMVVPVPKKEGRPKVERDPYRHLADEWAERSRI